MSTTINSIHLQGLQCELIEVEVHISRGLPAFHIVGLGDTAIHESKERVRSATINSHFSYPTNRKTVNLAPAHIKKQGPIFDLAIAVGLLIESQQLSIKHLKNSLFVGELALNGSVKGIAGVLVISNFARKNGFKRIYLPAANLNEAQIINGIEIIGLNNLEELKFSNSLKPFPSSHIHSKALTPSVRYTDFSLIHGQKYAKRALEIAAAGRHHILMHGPPGCGKTILSRAFPGILPALSLKEKIEISQIYSIKSLLNQKQPLIQNRPFREVHHTASSVAIIGGGRQIQPGEISLAHKGVLFLDEIAEFPRQVLEVLRQPLETKQIQISRASGSCKFPASFQLIAAMNPCHCGWYMHPSKECRCSSSEIEKYKKRISGPLRDRLDIIIKMQSVKLPRLQNAKLAESSQKIHLRVSGAYKIQQERYKKEAFNNNAELTLKGLKKYINLSKQACKTLKLASEKLDVSMRSYNRILKLSRTIADLAKSEMIKDSHLTEAISYRNEP